MRESHFNFINKSMSVCTHTSALFLCNTPPPNKKRNFYAFCCVKSLVCVRSRALCCKIYTCLLSVTFYTPPRERRFDTCVGSNKNDQAPLAIGKHSRGTGPRKLDKLLGSRLKKNHEQIKIV